MRTESPKKVEDTLLCVVLGAVFLTTDAVELFSEMYWFGVMLIGNVTTESYYTVQYSLFMARMFINSSRAAVFPLAALLVRYNLGDAVKILDILRPARYKPFTDEVVVEEYNIEDEHEA